MRRSQISSLSKTSPTLLQCRGGRDTTPKKFSVVQVDGTQKGCFGLIRSKSGSVCLKEIVDCKTKNHVKEKFLVEEPMLLVARMADSAFAQPSIWVALLSDALLAKILGEFKTLDDWYITFEYINLLEAPVSVEALEQREKDRAKAASFIKMPFKHHMGQFDNDNSFVNINPFEGKDTDSIKT